MGVEGWTGQRTAHTMQVSTQHRVQQKPKGEVSFHPDNLTISHRNFPAFVKISLQTGKDSGRVP